MSFPAPDLPSKGKPLDTESEIAPAPPDFTVHAIVNEQTAKDFWTVLLVFRCINALCLRTFFQPDEYFQALEPAWQMAFGTDSGAWITWEWQHQLRSSLHPAIFAAVYYVAENIMKFLAIYSPQFRGFVLSVLPNLVQAYFAALGDYYTWQLSEKIYGLGSNAGWATLVISMLSPWQWFCSTRTFSNCLETTMTITALFFWPWKVSTNHALGTASQAALSAKKDEEALAKSLGAFETTKSIKHLRISLVLAAMACILRPTNSLIWFSILMPVLAKLSSSSRLPTSDYLILTREFLICGFTALAVSAISDRLYFDAWTFPPFQWLNFNISQDLAVFYGRNDWHYYLSQGLPLLLTTYFPFSLVALWRSAGMARGSIQFIFTTTVLLTIVTLSLISHKEVRFIYPLLPLLHILTAPVVASFFSTNITSTTRVATSNRSSTTTTRRKPLLILLLLTNIAISIFTTQFHQNGVLSVLKFLREDYEFLTLTNGGVPLTTPSIDTTQPFVGFLMPCHSTPWRSQLYHRNLTAWALTCSPPIDIPPHTAERANYRDEADRFYDNPKKFLKEEINSRERPWPRYIVGFEGIEGVLREYYENEMRGFKVREKWRGQNSFVHDDWRRRGDVVVWEFVDGSQVRDVGT